MESPTRQRIDVPRPSADNGLAEWTTKIKALQRDVDADEELEQRRLEEEIRTSRLARSRRSAQFAGRVSLPLGGIGEDDIEKGSATGPVDALYKLTGEPARTGPSPTAAAVSYDKKPSAVLVNPTSSSTSKPEPVSLAAFIGGKATGPRLNKPVPQPDAHDPTLFEQRTRADIVAPHPVFGSGGVALAGLVGKGREAAEPRREINTKTPERNTGIPAREGVKSATSGKPLSASTYSNGGTTAAPARSWVRERTVSSPSPYMPMKPAKSSPPPVIPAGSPGLKGRVESLYAHANRSSERVSSPPVLRGSKSTDKMTQRPAAPAKPDSLRRPQPAGTEVSTPRRVSSTPLSASTSTPPPRTQTLASSTPTKPTPTSSPISVPFLARPIQPQTRPVSSGPHIPLSRNLAPAFLKPQQQKDLTPSLSRLQGRGFVQSFVKLTSEIESAAPKNGGSSERPVASPSPKRNSVLERWNPPSPSPSPSSGSPVSAPPLRKARTFDFPGRTTQEKVEPTVASTHEPVRPTPPSKPASLVASTTKPAPTKAKSTPVPAPGDVLPLGSSNTLISYIKPTKTSDAPPTDSAEARTPRSKTPSRNFYEGLRADELGARPRSRSSTTRSPSPTKPTPRTGVKSDLASSVPSNGRPLSHPTKDRARLRRKGAGAQTQSSSDYQQERMEELVTQASTAAKYTPAGKEGVAPAPEVTPPDRKSQTPSPSAPIHRGEPSKTPLAQAQARGEKVRRLQDTWSNQGPIGVKPLRKPPLVSPSPTRSSFGAPAPQVKPKASAKQALPSLAVVPDTPGARVMVIPPPSPPLTPPLSVSARQERAKSPSSPAKHGRIPSTGSRATVMDVAQALNAAATPSSTSPPPPKSPSIPTSPRGLSGAPSFEENGRQRDPGGWNEVENERTITPAIIKAERRRSNYDKYASFTLPVLPEEKTPVSSPAGTLKGTPGADISISGGAEESKQELESEARPEKPVLPTKPDFVRAPSKIRIDVVDEPVPVINAAKIWDVSPPKYVPDPDARTVSVEVLSAVGGNATEVTKEEDEFYVFYETEVLAIVHRAKSRSSGLVATKVWAWQGRKAEMGEKEEKRLQELAKRYGTALLRCGQYAEPRELVNVLGGTLVTRQGQRSLWSSENTTMHVTRSSAGVILIDEVDLDVKNLCSGFSYCISLLDTLWVWSGCGSVLAERSAALRYARILCSNNEEKKVVEVEEGNEDEMFWMFLGEDGYARADYWKWRKNEKGVDPRVWLVNCSNIGSEVTELETFPAQSDTPGLVLVVHLAYEVFALVGSAARGQRRNIKLGLTLAQELSTHTARSKPFRPPVHVLIFPSQVPLDLQAAIRGLNAEAIHGTEEVPDHMNLLTLNDAWKQLRQKDWDQKELEDGTMMPLGLSPC